MAPDSYWQAYGAFEYDHKEKNCDHFWEMREVSNKKYRRDGKEVV